MKLSLTKEARTNAALAIGSGALLSLAFPPIPTGIAAFVGFVPFLFLMERMKSAAQAFRFSYLTFLVLHLGTVYWISGWTGDDVWLKAAGVAVNIIWPLTFTIPSLLYYMVVKRMPAAYAAWFFPVFWVAWEWLSHMPELSFPWLIMANTQTYDIHKIQFIEYTGTFGISLWVTAVNALIYYGLRQSFQGVWKLRSRRLHYLLGALVLLLAIPEIHSRVVLNDKEISPTIRVGITQPDVDPYDKWGDGLSPLQKVQMLARQYDTLVDYQEPELVIMPETAIPFRIMQPSYNAEWNWLRSHVDERRIPLLTGFPYLQWYEDGEAPASAKTTPEKDYRYDDFNSAMLLMPLKGNVQLYKKSKLTPMSERIPYLNDLPFLADILTWGVGISNWGLGNDTTVFRMQRSNGETVAFWPMICYETLYPDFVAGFVRRGSQFLCVITNDGWFGPTSGPYQLKQFTVLRAIENRRAVARSANNGVSCFISPYGEISQETELYTRTTIAADVPLRSDMTFYVRHGDILSILCLIVSFLMFIFMYTRPNKEHNHDIY